MAVQRAERALEDLDGIDTTLSRAAIFIFSQRRAKGARLSMWVDMLVAAMRAASSMSPDIHGS